MATEEEIYKIVARVEGEAEVQRLTGVVSKAEDEILRLSAALKAGGPMSAQYAAEMRRAAEAIATAQPALRAAQASTRDLGRATLEASRAFEDAQFGLTGVLNNIPSLVTAMGGTAGLAGVISVVAVGAKILYDHWNDLAQAFGGGHTKTEADRMEELGKKTEKTANEMARLAKFERERAAGTTQATSPTVAESAQTKAVNEAFINSPIAGVNAAIRAIHGPALENARPAEEVAKEKSIRDRLAEVQRRNREEGATPTAAQRREAPLRGQLDVLAAKEERRIADWIEQYRGKVATEAGALKAFTGDLDRTGLLPDLAKKLRKAQETPEYLKEEEKQEQLAQKWFDDEEAAFRSRKADFDLEGQKEEDAQKRFDDIERDFEDRKAKWEVSGIVDPAEQAMVDQRNRIALIQAEIAAQAPGAGDPKVMGSQEFAKSLLSARGQDPKEILQKQLNVAERQLAALEVIKLRGVVARIGPP